MSLGSLIYNSHKEIAGSRTKNRLTVQISYAIQLIMDFYSTDFLIMMDYIEDVSVISNPNNPSAIHLYQIKTKSSDKQYLLSTVIKDEWFQKLYKNAIKYRGYVDSASLVCNTDIVTSTSTAGSEVFINEKTCLDDKAVQANIKKIRKAIAEDQNVDESEIDLSKFYFVRSTLSTKRHKEEIEYQFQVFLLKQEADLQVATAKSIFQSCITNLTRGSTKKSTKTALTYMRFSIRKGWMERTLKISLLVVWLSRFQQQTNSLRILISHQ